MDALTGLLDGPRARGAFLLRAVFSAPWAIRIEDEAPLTIVVVTRGSALFTGPGGPVAVQDGDVVLVRGPEAYSFADAADTAVGIRILPGQVCVDGAENLVSQSMALGLRTWGNVQAGAGGETEMLIGTYAGEAAVGARVLSRLPPASVLRGLDSPLVALLAAEIAEDALGQSAVLDRLLDLLLVTCLRQVFAETVAETPSWFAAQDDPVVGQAVRLLHHHPAHPWTVASVAAACGLSRAALSSRFTALVGEPPMRFLTGWRIAIAADLLTSSDATLEAVAGKVGYGNAFALSAAFKRVRGISPAEYRRTATLEPVALHRDVSQPAPQQGRRRVDGVLLGDRPVRL